jgi:hypothetical protein
MRRVASSGRHRVAPHGWAHSTCRIVGMTATDPAISVVSANEASWEDLQTVFGARGQGSRSQCQRYKLRRRESLASFPAEETRGSVAPTD